MSNAKSEPIISFRDFQPADIDSCLALFDLNSPAFFAPNERQDYFQFLEWVKHGYFLGMLDQAIVATYGLYFTADKTRAQLAWIIVSPHLQGSGIGSEMMHRVLSKARAECAKVLEIKASHLSAPFFAKFGAVGDPLIPDGWGKGMHRIDMNLPL